MKTTLLFLLYTLRAFAFTEAESILLSDTLYPETKNQVEAYVKKLNDHSVDLVKKYPSRSGEINSAKEYAIKKYIFRLNQFKETRKAYFNAIIQNGIVSANNTFSYLKVEDARLLTNYYKINTGTLVVSSEVVVVTPTIAPPQPTIISTPTPTITPVDPSQSILSLSANCPTSATIGSAYSCTFSGSSSQSSDQFIYSIDSDSTCPWITLDATNRYIYGTPLQSQLGNCDLTIRLSNGAVTTTRAVSISVAPSPSQSSSDIDFEVITLLNTSSVKTPVLVRTTGLFKKGTFPSNYSIKVTRIDGGREAVPAQIDETVRWSDGSLKFGVIAFKDIDLPADSSRRYVIQATNVTPSVAPVHQLSELTDDVKILFTNISRRTAGSTPIINQEPDMVASLLDAKARPTRVTQIASGPVVSGWQIWQMAKQGNSEHDHLKIYWYVWKWATGKTEVTAVVSQDWWEYGGANGKHHLDYDAKMVNGSNTIYDYGTLHHYYHAQWAAVRMDNDLLHGLPHWIPANAIPTIFVKRDKHYLVKTGLLPPFNPDIVPSSRNFNHQSYLPLRSMDHSRGWTNDQYGYVLQDIDATGGWAGKGVWNEFDVYTLLKQTPLDSKLARVQSFAGLTFPRHFRTRAARQRPGDSVTDISSTQVSLKLDGYKKVGSSWTAVNSADYDFTNDGMPTPKHYGRYVGADTGYLFKPIEGMDPNGMSGGSGPISFRYPGSSHGVNYTLPHYLFSGYRYYLESSIDIAFGGMLSMYGSCYGMRVRSKWENFCGGNENWAGMSEVNGQERGVGWSNNLMSATGLVPDSDVTARYVRLWNEHTGNYYLKFIDDVPTYAPTWNGSYHAISSTSSGIWQNSYIILGSLNNYSITESVGFKRLAEETVRFLNTHAVYPAQLMHYYSRNRIDDAAAITNHNPQFFSDAYLSMAVNLYSDNRIELPAPTLGYPYSQNDVIYFHKSNTPPPISIDTKIPYYLINVTGNYAALAISPDGTPIDLSISAPVTNIHAGTHIKSYKNYTVAGQNGSYIPYAGHYIYEALSALEYAKYMGVSTINDSYLVNLRFFLENSTGHASRMLSYPTTSITPTVVYKNHLTPPPLTAPPLFTSNCSLSATQENSYTCNLSATDSDGDLLTFDINSATNTCNWLTISGNRIAGTARDSDVGSCTASVRVSDGGNIVKKDFTITISNRTPTISAPAFKSVSGLIGELIVITSSEVSSNEEGEGEYSLVAPLGGETPLCDTYGTLSINSANGEVKFNPSSNPLHVGDCYTRIRFNDKNPSGIVETSVRFNVSKTYSPALLMISDADPSFSTSLTYEQTQDVVFTVMNIAPGTATNLTVKSFLTPYFSLISTNCTNLIGGSTCNVTVRFRSGALLTYSDRLEISYGNDQGLQNATGNFNFSGIDTLASNAPTGLALVTSSSLRLTRPTIRISGVFTGDTIKLFKDNCQTEIASGIATGSTLDLTIDENAFLADTTYLIKANAKDSHGNISSCSTASLSITTPKVPLLDTSFASDGGKDISVSQYDYGYKVIKQSDGKLILIGQAQSTLTAIRFNTDGTIDSTFSYNQSIPCTARAGGDSTINATASGMMDALIEANGKVVILASCYTYSTGPVSTDTFLMRLNTNGTPDTSFDSDGFARIDVSSIGKEDFGFALARTTDGKYVIGGAKLNASGNYDGFVTRIHSHGVVDTTFNSHSFDFDGKDMVRDLAITSDDKIILGGRVSVGAKEEIFVRRLFSNGDLDTNFGVAGTFKSNLETTNSYWSEKILLQNNGPILVAGLSYDQSVGKLPFVARLTSDGALDTSFSGDGVAMAAKDSSSVYGMAMSVSLHPSGEIIITATSSSFETYLYRLNSSGSFSPILSPDGINGSQGKRLSTVGIFGNGTYKIQPMETLFDEQGRLLISGTIGLSGASDLGLMRLILDY